MRHGKALNRDRAMIILKLGFAGLFLFALHQFLLEHGGPAGAHVITGAIAFLIVLILGLTRESLV